MKIALVNSEHSSPSGNDHGGIATYTYTLARLLAQRGHEVHLLIRSSVSPDHIPPSVQFHKFGYARSCNPLIRMCNLINRNSTAWEQGHSRSIVRKVQEIARGNGLDIIDIPEYGGLAGSYTIGRKIPCVITFHTPSVLVDTLNNTPPSIPRRALYHLEKQGVGHGTGYKSPSAALKNHVCNTFHLSEESVSVIRNPFDFSSLHHLHHPAPPRFDILFSGRLERRKGAEIILQSIREIISIGDDVTVTFAGETEIGNALNYRHAIERILSPAERARCWFLGPISSAKVLSLYVNSSMLLFPSLFENCPYSLIEALASGLPVVATEGSGISEIVKHGDNGLLFSADDREQLLKNIRTLYHDRDHAHLLGRNAAQSIRRLFNTEEILDTTIRFYQSIIHANGKKL
jgi:glycogen(starch) synthase